MMIYRYGGKPPKNENDAKLAKLARDRAAEEKRRIGLEKAALKMGLRQARQNKGDAKRRCSDD